MTLRDERSEDQQQLDALRWLVVGGTLAVLILVVTAIGTWGTTRSYVELVVVIPIATAVVLAGRHLRRD